MTFIYSSVHKSPLDMGEGHHHNHYIAFLQKAGASSPPVLTAQEA